MPCECVAPNRLGGHRRRRHAGRRGRRGRRNRQRPPGRRGGRDTASSSVAVPNRPPDGPPPAVAGDPTRREYVVFLNDAPPLAKYRGGIAGLAPTAADLNGDVHLDLGTPAALAYSAYLDGRRAAAIARLKAVAPRADIGWQYHIVAHGFTVGLTADEAVAAKHMPGFDLVFPDEKLAYEMDSSAEVVRATDAWQAVGGVEEAGLGARIAVMDSGMDIEHPWFRDDGMPPPPAGYPSATLVTSNGVLSYPEPERFVNGKVIAARVFVRNGTTQTLQSQTPLIGCSIPTITSGNPNPPPAGCAGTNDHGLHVAGIASGRRGTYELKTGSLVIPTVMSGVAPMAHVLTYRNIDPSVGATVAGLEQSVKDEVDVVNMSQGTVGWLLARPERHPISLAADAAADAGTVFVVSAGNAGSNGRTSLSGGWKYHPRVMAVGNTTTAGSLDQKITVTGAGVPADAAQIVAAPRGGEPIQKDLSGPLFLAPGGGCSQDTGASGKIVVVDQLGAGNCTATVRADNMQKSGAKAIVFYRSSAAYAGYSDGGGVSNYAANLPLASAAIGTTGGRSLVAWLAGGGSGTATISGTITRGRSEPADFVSGSSSQGPGLDWQIKPDIAAPGQNILASRIYVDAVAKKRLYPVASISGTSMATPHVAGAVGVLRAVHPDWTVDQVISAIVNTSSPTLMVSPLDPKPAVPADAGPGRLDVAAALDPGAFLWPTTLSFGRLAEGATKSISVSVESDLEAPATWNVSVAPVGGSGATVTVEPTSITLQPGEKATFNAVLTVPADVADSEHWGDVILETDAGGTSHRLRQQYYAFVDRLADRKNVLIVDWAYGSKVDHTRYYTEALEAAGLTYDVWVLDSATARVSDRRLPLRTSHPPLAVMSRYDLVILNANESKTSMMSINLSGLYQYQNLMLRGGSFLIAGQGTPNFWRYLSTAGRLPDTPANRQTYRHTWPFQWAGAPNQNVGCEMCLTRYFTGFTPELTATLSGRLLVPFPQRPVTDSLDVILEPNPGADDGAPFGYAIDLSTGDNAPEGAAGNQYTFASGSLVTSLKPSTSNTLATGLGDYDFAEGIIDDLVPLARPLWQYTGMMAVDRVNPLTMTEQTKVVGTYVAGQQHPGTGVTWNAMFWGFGLEGVGKGDDERTVTRERLLGDTFNFLARNIAGITLNVLEASAPEFEVELALPAYARPPELERAEVDWGDGETDVLMGWGDPFGGGRVYPRADDVTFTHAYARPGEYEVALVLYPRADAAPMYIAGTVTVTAPPTPEPPRNPNIYLPLSLHGMLGGDAPMPTVWLDRR